jgi:hypothetical protein
VLRSTAIGPSARVSRSAGLAGILITLVYVLAAPAALADRGPQPNADELWRSYPLEQEPATTAAAPAADEPSRASAPVADGASDSGPPWAVLAAIGVASAALVVAARRRRRPAAASGYATEAAHPVGPDAVPAVGGSSAESAAVRTAAAAAAAPVPARVARGQAPYSGRAQRSPAATPRAAGAAGAYDRATAPPKAPVCQIRWSRRGRRFYAATVDAEGTVRRLGRSAVVDSAGPEPPEETPEARAALLRLAKDLRERGWRPLRARGVDFDERQWYARRFRWPTDAEVAAGRPGGGIPSPDVADRPGGPR